MPRGPGGRAVSTAPSPTGAATHFGVSSAIHDVVARITAVPKPYTVRGLTMAVRHADGVVDRVHHGTDATGAPVTADTLFALSSAGKMAVALLVLRLVDDGAVALDAPAGTYLSRTASDHPGVTIRRLLSHSAGLPLELPDGALKYGAPLDARALIDASLRVPLAYAPGTLVQYSNAGYGVLAAVVERVTGERFWDAVKRHVLQPLGVDAFPSDELPRAPAVVEDVGTSYLGTAREPINGAYYRGLAIPWTGLFSTADALLAITRAYVDGGGIVSPTIVTAACRDQCVGLPGGFNTADAVFGFGGTKPLTWPHCAWGLGVELRGDKAPHWTPKSAGADSFGHLGSSGCLAWHDPTSGATWVVLGTQTTNNGWLLRHGTQIGAAALAAAHERRGG